MSRAVSTQRKWTLASVALTDAINGRDIFSLQRLMGHSDLSVLKKYLKLTDQDARETHARFSPVDRLRE